MERNGDAEPEKTKKISISPAQVAGGALASVTAAFLGSRLGVAGTVVGAGLTSVVITVGGALYQRSLEATKEKADAAAKAALRRSRAMGLTREEAAPQETARQETAGQETAGRETAWQRETPEPPAKTGTAVSPAPDPAEQPTEVTEYATQVFAADRTRALRWDGTRFVPSAERSTVREPEEIVAPEPKVTPRRWGRWSVLAATAALVFGLGMLVITGFEGITGGPLSGGSGGTSLGRVFHPTLPEQSEPTQVEAPPAESDSPSTEPTTRPEQAPETDESPTPTTKPEQPETSTPDTSEPVPSAPETSVSPEPQEDSGVDGGADR